MFKELKNQFMQTSFLTTIWVLGITTLVYGNSTVKLSSFWSIIGISIIIAAIFGIIYPYIWNYGTWTAPVNITITTLVNFLSGFAAVFLFSKDMFELITPYWWAILLLNLLLHIIAFYFYRNYQNKKMVTELNHLAK
ncbi:hypothetical protein IW492_03175 [Enterococcus sp. BWB1-3]|uniref:hypothetical protein n=1 Tax=Enterococcus sp. BWB1-3 TaxID=2787713 RepID=UPI00192291DA|nr:hypothetical protein [Enterococcus sp. BWB1-3]MBL1228235.1 hypothetical protein [Enterococcus sp. BWB1-3]